MAPAVKKKAAPKKKAAAPKGAALAAQLAKVKRQLPERVKAVRETNLMRAELADAQSRARYAAELDRIRGESGLYSGSAPREVAQRADLLAGALGMQSQASGSAFYPRGYPGML